MTSHARPANLETENHSHTSRGPERSSKNLIRAPTARVELERHVRSTPAWRRSEKFVPAPSRRNPRTRAELERHAHLTPA